jgi:hypothetical protein
MKASLDNACPRTLGLAHLAARAGKAALAEDRHAEIDRENRSLAGHRVGQSQS